MPIPSGWERLGFTSGRRTPLGNKLVGGVPHSSHLEGTAADFTASVDALRAFFGPNVHILDEGDHRHVSGLSGVPYYGKRGTAGLNETSTRATQPMQQPFAPTAQQATPFPNWQNPGVESMEPPSVLSEASIPDLVKLDPASLTQNMPQVKPHAFDPGGKGWVIAGIIADAIAGGFGGRPGFAPTYLAMQQDERQQKQRREEYAQSRKDRLEDAGTLLQRQIALKQWEQAHPDPAPPSSAAKMAYEIGLKPGTPEFSQFIRRYAERPIMIGGQPYGYGDEGSSGERTVTRTGTDASGRRVVQYSDGSIDYAE